MKDALKLLIEPLASLVLKSVIGGGPTSLVMPLLKEGAGKAFHQTAEQKSLAVAEVLVRDIGASLDKAGYSSADVESACEGVFDSVQQYLTADQLIKSHLKSGVIKRQLLDLCPIRALYGAGDPAAEIHERIIEELAPRLRAIARELPGLSDRA